MSALEANDHVCNSKIRSWVYRRGDGLLTWLIDFGYQLTLGTNLIPFPIACSIRGDGRFGRIQFYSFVAAFHIRDVRYTVII